MERPVFISYSSADKPAAEQICGALEQAGHACWIAPRNIEPGMDYPAAILGGVRNSRLVVVILSASALESPHILTEIGHAFGEKKPILPFRLSDIKLPPNFDYYLATSQWLDAHDGCTTANLARLQEAVAQELAGGPAGPPPPAIRRDKRIPLLIAAAAALLLIVGGGILYSRRPAANVAGNALPAAGPSAAPVDTAKTAPGGNQAQTTPIAGKPQPWVNPKDGLSYVWIPPGTFTMGCSPGDSQCDPDENPSRPVDLPTGYWIGQTEVTNAAYHRVVPSFTFPPSEAKLPVVRLSRLDAKAYCAAVGGRLPFEAEWEYAARGGTTGAYPAVPSKIAWYEANSGDMRHEVATLQPNAYGLYDMLGNASEWVFDRYYNKYYVDSPAIGKVDEPIYSNSTAVTRGGFWESEAKDIRVSRRSEQERDLPVPMAGVRCVVDRK